MYAIVESWHVHRLCKAGLQGALGAVHALGDRARGIQAVADVLQVARHVGAALHALLGYLVAYRPHHDARMVAVGQHEVLHILVAPLLEEAGVAVLALRIDPHVERFGHDHHAQRVAHLHLHLARHVVSRAYGVAAHVLENLYLAYECGLVDGGAQWSQVVVQADALELARHAVEPETAIGTDADGAQTYFFLDFIDSFAIVHQLYAQPVERRLFGRPQLRFLDFHRGACLPVFVNIVVRRGYGLSLFVEQAHFDAQWAAVAARLTGLSSTFLLAACLDGFRRHLHLSLLAVDGECAEIGAPAVEALLAREHQRHRAVQSGTGIPARTLLNVLQVYLQQVVHGHGTGRRGSGLDIWCDVHAESVVAVSPVAGLLAVDGHRRLSHGTVEHQLGMPVEAGGDGQRALVVAAAYPGQRA